MVKLSFEICTCTQLTLVNFRKYNPQCHTNIRILIYFLCFSPSRLDEKKGIEIGGTYRNRKQARTFVRFIAADEREKIAAKFSSVKFLSVLSDGSTDSAVIEEEIVYARYAVQGDVTSQFVGLQAIAKANAENIAGAIERAVECGFGVTRDEWRKKLVAVGTDGAAVMLGSKSGVVTRIKGNDLTYVLPIHCMAHRLELSFKDAAGKNECHKKLDTLLLGLYYFYHNSPLNRANLKASFDSLQKKPLLPTRIGGTRWVSHILKAVDHFIRGYSAVVQHLEQVTHK